MSAAPMQQLHETYGDGPLMMRIPVRRQAIVLAAHHVHRVLAESPEPFSADSSEKHASLTHFQPKTVLISSGAERADRRRFNEAVLDMPRPMHRRRGTPCAPASSSAFAATGSRRRRGASRASWRPPTRPT